MKRFTDTEIWDREWYMSLAPYLKCLMRYMFDKCDASGVWSPNWKLASVYIGSEVSEADLEKIPADQWEIVDGKVFLPGFIPFQYGELSEKCVPHKAVIKLLAKNKIKERVSVGYAKDKPGLTDEPAKGRLRVAEG